MTTPHLRARRIATLFSALVLLGAAMSLTPAGAANARPAVTVTSGPTVEGTTAAIGYSVNRSGKAIGRVACTLGAGGVTTSANCGQRVTAPKTKPAAYSVSLASLSPGSYTYTINVTLTDGGRASVSTSFVVAEVADTSCWNGEVFGPPLNFNFADVRYAGPIGTRNNATRYLSDDGTCEGVWGNDLTVVQATSGADAITQCEAIYGTTLGSVTVRMDFDWLSAPGDYYICDISLTLIR